MILLNPENGDGFYLHSGIKAFANINLHKIYHAVKCSCVN